jgi:hypothetical protein
MKIGQVEFTWRAHRQACVVKIGGEQRVFRFNKKTTRKELFAKIRSFAPACCIPGCYFLATRKTKQSLPVMATVKKPTQPKMQSLPGYK